MPYSIQDNFRLDVYFDEVAFPFDQASTLNYCHIVSSVRIAIPMLTLGITDAKGWLSSNNVLRDGIKITVALLVGSAESAETRTYAFRLSSYKDSSTGTGTSYTIEGYLDSIRYFADCIAKPVRGTSDFVLSAIAKACNLQYLGVGTQDSQVWYPANKPMYRFAQDVAAYGYATNNSCMAMALDASNTLIYRDVSAMDAPQHKLGFLELRNGVVLVTGFKPTSQSGSANQTLGYSFTTVEQQAFRDGEIHVAQKSIGVVLNEAGQVSMSDAKKQLKGGRVMYAPVEPGNNHPDYHRAYHQNKRASSLFSTTIECVTPVATSIQVLDTVEFSTAQASSSNPSAEGYGGLYRVLSHVVYLVPGQYSEKFTLGRRTVPAKAPGQTQSRQASIIDTSTTQRTQPMKAPVTSSANPAPQTDTAAAAVVTAAQSAGTAGVVASAARVVAPLTNMQAAVAMSPLLPLLVEIESQINVYKTAGVAAILAIAPLPPDNVARVAEKTAQLLILTNYIATKQPELDRAAKRARAESYTAGNILSSIVSQTGLILSGASTAAVSTMTGMSALYPSTSSTAASAGAGLAALLNANSNVIANESNNATNAVNDLADKAARYNQIVDDFRQDAEIAYIEAVNTP